MRPQPPLQGLRRSPTAALNRPLEGPPSHARIASISGARPEACASRNGGPRLPINTGWQSSPRKLCCGKNRSRYQNGMWFRARHLFLRVAMALLLATSMVSAGFVHRTIISTAEAETVRTLAAMGVTAADLCAVPGEDGKTMEMGDCPVCHLASGMMVPELAPSAIDIELRYVAGILVPARTRESGRVFNPATPVRAPPLA